MLFGNSWVFSLYSDANVHAQTGTGDTALTYACENGHTDVAAFLLEHGANLVSNSCDWQKWHSFFYYKFEDSYWQLKLLSIQLIVLYCHLFIKKWPLPKRYFVKIFFKFWNDRFWKKCLLGNTWIHVTCSCEVFL